MTEALNIPVRTWMNDEAGVALPAVVVLGFIALTDADPNWLLTRTGPTYRSRQLF